MKTYSRIGYENTRITDGFWQKRQKLNEEVTAQAVYDRFSDTYRFKALSCTWTPDTAEYTPHIFWDSDVAKWIEGVAYILMHHENPQLEALADKAIQDIIHSQAEDGYFNSHYLVMHDKKRFSVRWDHELYCAGHLFEAAAAYFEATGKRDFLDAMCRYADYIYRIFVIEDSAAFATGGHPEIELALVRLYETTGNKKYLELSKHFIDKRGGKKDKSVALSVGHTDRYAQDHLPLREQKTAEGHAVRAGYIYSAMADIARLYDDKELFNACRSIFRNIVTQKMYVTGAVGSDRAGEAFTEGYELQNARGKMETCAAIALILFANRMLRMEADSIYADTIERVLYNGFLSSTSLDGRRFFYSNPLEINPRVRNANKSVTAEKQLGYPIMERAEVFGCSCCPPNIVRFIPSVANLLYTHDEDTLFVHQYMNAETHYQDMYISQETDYPTESTIRLHVESPLSNIAVRIPAWCSLFTINHPYTLKNGYAYIKASDSTDIVLHLEMKPLLYEANPKVHEDAGKVCLMYGPIVYCLEEADNGEYLGDVAVCSDTEFTLEQNDAYGIPVIYANGYRRKDFDSLYRTYQGSYEKIRLRFIPYFAFANRGACEMRVWINVK